MADFELIEGDRFNGEFLLLASGSYSPTDREKAYLTGLKEIICDLVPTESERADDRHPSITQDLATLRTRIVSPLRKSATELVRAPQGTDRDEIAERALEHVFYYKGAFSERRAAILRRPFEILSIPHDEHGFPARPIEDIEIRTRDVAISDEQQRFKVDVDSTRKVIKVVLAERRSRWYQFVP